MIKRFLSLVLCLCLLSTATVALADNEVTYPDGQTNFDNEVGVNITAIAKDTSITNADDVYSIEIVWGDMKFAYGYGSGTTTATWNPETHEYEVTNTSDNSEATKGWYMLNEGTEVKPSSTNFDLSAGTQDTVMVFNHSNQPVNAKIVITDEIDSENLTATFTKSSGSELVEGSSDTYALEAGVEKDPYNADKANVIGKVSITQESMTSTTELTIAKLNVTISKPATTNTETPEQGE